MASETPVLQRALGHLEHLGDLRLGLEPGSADGRCVHSHNAGFVRADPYPAVRRRGNRDAPTPRRDSREYLVSFWSRDLSGRARDPRTRGDSVAESCESHCWGTWTRTKNKGTRNLRVANYTIPQGAEPESVPRIKSRRPRRPSQTGSSPGPSPGAERLQRGESPDRLGLTEQLHRLEQRRRDATTADSHSQRPVGHAWLQTEAVDQRVG